LHDFTRHDDGPTVGNKVNNGDSADHSSALI